MKLALGTAQFGLPYGIANRVGQVAEDEGEAIIARARAAGIRTLDTAVAYGDSEQRLGAIGVCSWQVVSKLPAIPDACADVGRWVAASVRGSLERLRIDRLHGLLLHRPGELLEASGVELHRALQAARHDGLVDKIGISIYDPSELDRLWGRFEIDIVQAPFNLIDARLLSSGWLDRLSREGVETHVRSVFLQGLLLMPRNERPAKFARWSALLAEYDAWLERTQSTPLQACLRYAMTVPEIDRVIVGVETLDQLEQLVAAATLAEDVPGGVAVPGALRSADADLLNPARWAAL